MWKQKTKLMSRFASNRKICTYEDFTVFEEDFRSIYAGWLTDTAVNFGATYLKDEILGPKKEEVCLVYAFLCELIKHAGRRNSETQKLLESVEADKNKWTAFILNDNIDPTVVSGGCHWTLLVHDPIQNVLWQLDPMSDTRPPHCWQFYQKIKGFFGNEYRVLDCPKMTVNGSCGIYILEYLHIIFQCLKEGLTDVKQMDFSRINDKFAAERRVYYCKVLNSLAEEQQRPQISFV
ncbi:unnamed protein product [Bursaphelenchus xylophilus]|uniref:(pine wood nematode) hypothetical protein n=1 Tax=Bursaphelenchus xylophilus TaxID=6326 RepID=A0A1I7RI52_BURXY|nr:unnamed protein product [Bursaphelenchus xylophilus]CAG9115151.1 unnamed protein product [Bursaphelenchus xylophilus]